MKINLQRQKADQGLPVDKGEGLGRGERKGNMRSF